jgi:hypothetical protein
VYYGANIFLAVNRPPDKVTSRFRRFFPFVLFCCSPTGGFRN